MLVRIYQFRIVEKPSRILKIIILDVCIIIENDYQVAVSTEESEHWISNVIGRPRSTL